MAQLPTPQEIKEHLADTKQQDDTKRAEQAKKNKDFNNTGAGVIPEHIWKSMKVVR